jgi:hypothetical protein
VQAAILAALLLVPLDPLVLPPQQHQHLLQRQRLGTMQTLDSLKSTWALTLQQIGRAHV